MNIYFIGDIHGCFTQLQNLLNRVKFNYNKDALWLTGDLVEKGPDSFKVLKFLYENKNSVKLVLGNHDLNLIRLYFKKILYPKIFYESKYYHYDFDNMKNIIDWLRKQPLFRVNYKKKFVISHAGIPPNWNIKLSQIYSKKIQKILSGSDYEKIFYFLEMMFVKSCKWKKSLKYDDKIKFAINGFTRMRYCFKKTYDLDLVYKEFPNKILKNNLIPWFSIKNNIPKGFIIIFGHWSSLNGKGVPKNFYALDTGCYLGNKLTLLRWKDKKKFYETFY
ncbi:symmetrical bis(5'-nucleosyl)-tetraphosphatase [Buchnera aphidicola]|uniref:symmetrical bis(5'-nucleosyl)-tetraphosphatase n=1 Tax=Buchnera aphidicola TaxID=9 RepID=UPI0031B88472